MSYNVAFAYTRATKGYEGVVTWSTFASKEDFDQWYDDSIKEQRRIVAEGVSVEQCVQLVRLTPMACRYAAAFQEAKNPDTGELDIEIFVRKMLEIATLNAERG